MGQRVLIADHDGLLRDALRTALELEGVEVVGEAADVDEAVRLTTTLEPEIVLMDPSMPTSDGESAIEIVQRHCPDTRVVVPSMHEESSSRACTRTQASSPGPSRRRPKHLSPSSSPWTRWA